VEVVGVEVEFGEEESVREVEVELVGEGRDPDA